MTTKEFFEGVEHLDENSAFSEIEKYLQLDMKSIAVLDKEKVHSERIFYENERVKLTYADIFDKTDISLEYNSHLYEGWTVAIKNWLRYRIATTWGQYDNGKKYEMGLYTEPFECDATEIVKEVQKRTIQAMNPNLKSICYATRYGINGDNRFTIDDKVQLTTDTMNSFATAFQVFVDIVLKDKVVDDENFYKKYRLSKKAATKYGIIDILDWLPSTVRNIYRDIYYLENIDEWTADLTGAEEDVFESLCVFSYKYHTLGNFVLVPKGYNSQRASLVSDYWDLSLLYLKEMAETGEYKDENYKWYIENYGLFSIDMCFEEESDRYGFGQNKPCAMWKNHFEAYYKVKDGANKKILLPQNLEELKNFVVDANGMISIRGMKLLALLNDKLGENREVFGYFGMLDEQDDGDVLTKDMRDRTPTKDGVLKEMLKKGKVYVGEKLKEINYKKCSFWTAIVADIVYIIHIIVLASKYFKLDEDARKIESGLLDYIGRYSEEQLLMKIAWGILIIAAIFLVVFYALKKDGALRYIMLGCICAITVSLAIKLIMESTIVFVGKPIYSIYFYLLGKIRSFAFLAACTLLIVDKECRKTLLVLGVSTIWLMFGVYIFVFIVAIFVIKLVLGGIDSVKEPEILLMRDKDGNVSKWIKDE